MFGRLSAAAWNILQNREDIYNNKMQEAVAKIEGITQARVDFLATKLTIEVQEQDFTKIVKQIGKAVRKVEPDCEIIEI